MFRASVHNTLYTRLFGVLRAPALERTCSLCCVKSLLHTHTYVFLDVDQVLVANTVRSAFINCYTSLVSACAQFTSLSAVEWLNCAPSTYKQKKKKNILNLRTVIRKLCRRCSFSVPVHIPSANKQFLCEVFRFLWLFLSLRKRVNIHELPKKMQI